MLRTMFFALIALILCACHRGDEAENIDALSSSEPPIKCDISRGAWCFLRSPYTFTFFHAQDESFSAWKVVEDHWSNEPGFVLEDNGCGDVGHADTLEVSVIPDGVAWSGQQWRGVLVKLRADGSCNLRLLAPLPSQAPLDMAASALSTHVAICYEDRACTPNVIADKVYQQFKLGLNEGESGRER